MTYVLRRERSVIYPTCLLFYLSDVGPNNSQVVTQTKLTRVSCAPGSLCQTRWWLLTCCGPDNKLISQINKPYQPGFSLSQLFSMFPIDFLSYLRHDFPPGTGIYFVVKLDSMFHFCWVLIFSKVRSLEGSDFLLQQPAGG